MPANEITGDRAGLTNRRTLLAGSVGKRPFGYSAVGVGVKESLGEPSALCRARSSERPDGPPRPRGVADPDGVELMVVVDAARSVKLSAERFEGTREMVEPVCGGVSTGPGCGGASRSGKMKASSSE